jgi:AraC family transcriptional regulator
MASRDDIGPVRTPGNPTIEPVGSVTPPTLEPADGPSLPLGRLRRVEQYIDEKLQGPIPLAELSAVVQMSRFHFARLFARSTGVPPHRFIVQRRMEAARALLTAGTAPITVVARAVGFRTASHFTTTFHRLTGMTPSDYRRANGQPPAPTPPQGSPGPSAG